MATTKVYIGDTVTIQAEFRDTNNALIDADSNAVTCTIYRSDDLSTVVAASATRVSTGIYIYNWLVPNEEIIFIAEMKGNFSTRPQLKRIKARAVFRP
jgi:hypothetical protein